MAKEGSILLWVIYPFLFAVFPVLFLFNYNQGEVRIADLVIPMVGVVVGALILFFLLRFIVKSCNKSGLITLWFFVLFYSYSHVNSLIQSSWISGVGIGSLHISFQFLLAPLWVILFATCVMLVWRSHSDFTTVTRFLNGAAITAIIISVGSIAAHELTIPRQETTAGTPQIIRGEEDSASTSNANLPDIYYIILDAYTRQDTLEDMGYDNSAFIHWLEAAGFYVADKSISNYPSTEASLPSTLNMRYLTPEDNNRLSSLWVDNEVARLLKSIGYQYIAIQNANVPKELVGEADIGLAYRMGSMVGQNELMKYLLNNTALQPLTTLYLQQFLDENDRQARLYSFDRLMEVPAISVPTFTYAHIALPHPPFLFDRNGNPPQSNVADWVNKDLTERLDAQYVEQVIFTNKKVVEVVTKILCDSTPTPIIIIQGDHGVYWGEGRGRYILNAYYLPGGGGEALYESISPVNTFRVVFTKCFGADYGLLPDVYDARGTTR